MSDSTQYVFKPRSEVADWIDENIVSNGRGWTGFCYDNIYRVQRKRYQERLERLVLRLFVILIGMVVVCLSYLSLTLFSYAIVVSCGVLLIVLGFVMLSLEVRNGRRHG